ncbi:MULTISPECIES: NVEALA domain-containing protein [Bacteroides]|jgi:hypothetical protein|uniref:NVEALA protein n=3 Tax=Bacteroides TaxID=816 RepID=A0A412IPP3_9BACE|nr:MULTISPECIES: NVEALA domain-containing protein [Bacteroides]MBS1349424.1 hypothetical protein [Bacteroides sp.]KXT50006.1 hypothetical protein HMPREF2531_02508 [Bacteroides intestinalis]MCB6268644.1 NVEALA domain-containing protein [Bacteroides cellulosilyticus]MCG4968880.1 NVEALA domain-containing protein [Bacteroides cellulosilyticus]RGS40102.1 hypothetical protein DWX97_02185 [Bacteroides cellulosilyticus]
MKKFMKIAFVAAFAAIAGYGVYANQKVDTMSDLMLANVEALARYEVNPDCPNGCTSGNTGCYCYKTYPDQREVKWS